jgi:hypothetical protein
MQRDRRSRPVRSFREDRVLLEQSAPARSPVVPTESLAVFDDGCGPALYAADELDFDYSSGTLDKLAGAQWEYAVQLSTGVPEVLAVFDDGTGPAIYIGGILAAPDGDANLVKWGDH